MKIFIAGLLFLTLLVMSAFVSFAQQDPNYQKLVQEMEALKKQVSTLQNQLQTVENVEKMELAAKLTDAEAKLTDANAKLINAEFGRFERGLRNSNDNWLRTWSHWFLAIIGSLVLILGGAFWYWLKSKADQKIADEVEKSLNEFKEAVSKVNILADKIRVLDKEHAARVVADTMYYSLDVEESHPKEIKALSEEALLDVFRDGTRDKRIMFRILEILTHREFTQLVSPTLEFLNSTLDSHQGKELEFYTITSLREFVNLLGYTPTQETYEGLTKFLDRLVLREDTECTDFLLAATASSVATVGHELNKEDWIFLLKSIFSRLDNEPETMKGILHHLPDEMPSVDLFKDHLLELLERHDAEFVKDLRERRANANKETEENHEPKKEDAF